MEDMPCIYDISLINEHEGLKEDILNGKVIEILVTLLSGSKTTKELSKILKISNVQTSLYLNRLIQEGLVRTSEVKVYEGKIEKHYELATTNIQIMNYIKKNCGEDNNFNLELSAEHFATLTKNSILNIKKSEKSTYKIKAFFIKADDDTIKEFKKELEALYKKFEELENLDAQNTYGFISVLAPYEVIRKEGE
jgi:predicted ArsR family transcriptional regulator